MGLHYRNQKQASVFLMAYVRMFAVVATLLVALIPVLLVGAVDHVVGGDMGWAMDVNYSAWAMGQQFFVHDTLVFNYRKGDHDVAKVDKAGFDSCAVPPSAEVLESGRDVVMLSKPGEKYYICGLPSHCSVGNQKVAVTVWPHAQSPEEGTQSAASPDQSSAGNGERGYAGSYNVVVVVLMAVALIAM